MSRNQSGKSPSAGLALCVIVLLSPLLCHRCGTHQTANASDANPVAVKAAIKCPSAEFQDEAVFIASDKPIEFLCELEETIQKPEGYRGALLSYQWTVSSGDVEAKGPRAVWKNAQPGLQTITVAGKTEFQSKEKDGWFSSAPAPIAVEFHAEMTCLFPKYVPSIQHGKIDGYFIGDYPDQNDKALLSKISPLSRQRVKDHPETYTPPKLFYPVDKDTFFVKIFQGYRMGDFDLDPRFLKLEYPRFAAVNPKLLKKLDLLKKIMNDAGQKVTRFHFIYAFRSPHYNSGAREEDGEKTLKEPFSSHQYGLAVDMIVDENQDLVLDDLNHDNIIDHKDAKKLLAYVNMLDDVLKDDSQYRNLVGGAGWYYHHDYYERGEVAQTPYVHMDARGFTAENGSHIRWIGKDAINIQAAKDPYVPKKPIPKYPF